MRASRLLSLLMHLQTRGRITAAEMAQTLEVSLRTVHRDIDQLSAAGIPVLADRGRAGGFRLREGFRTQLAGLTAAEAETLFFAGLPGPAAELGLADLMAVSRDKLMAALPPAARAERVATRFHLDAAGWFRAHESLELLPAVARAVWSRRMLAIRYASDGRVVSRTLGPAGLVLKAGIWYLVAQSGSVFRTYRVGRMQAAEVQDTAYERPADFDLAAYWAKSAREYELSSYRDSAVVRISPEGRKLVHLLGPYVEEALAKTAGEPDRRGWVRCTIPMEPGDYGLRELMRLGPEVEVLGPAPMRARFARLLRAMLRRHAHRRSGPARA